MTSGSLQRPVLPPAVMRGVSRGLFCARYYVCGHRDNVSSRPGLCRRRRKRQPVSVSALTGKTSVQAVSSEPVCFSQAFDPFLVTFESIANAGGVRCRSHSFPAVNFTALLSALGFSSIAFALRLAALFEAFARNLLLCLAAALGFSQALRAARSLAQHCSQHCSFPGIAFAGSIAVLAQQPFAERPCLHV